MPFSKGAGNGQKGAGNGFALILLANCTPLKLIIYLGNPKKSKKNAFPFFLLNTKP